MKFFSGKRTVMVLLVVAAVMLLPLAASALQISVDQAYWDGYRSTPAGSGVVGGDGWSGISNAGFRLSWDIDWIDSSNHALGLKYVYTVSGAASETTNLQYALSHVILQISPLAPASDFTVPTGSPAFSTDSPKTWTPDPAGTGDNPSMPANLYGIKWDAPSGALTYTLAFETTRLPVWGNFYAKDGKHSDISATAWNAGFLTSPTSLTTDFTNWVPTPDSKTFGNPVPLPPTVLLLGSGLLGLGLLGWRRRQQ